MWAWQHGNAVALFLAFTTGALFRGFGTWQAPVTGFWLAAHFSSTCFYWAQGKAMQHGALGAWPFSGIEASGDTPRSEKQSLDGPLMQQLGLPGWMGASGGGPWRSRAVSPPSKFPFPLQ